MNMQTVSIQCDTTELDRVIAKLTEALHLMDRLETSPSVNELALATAAAIAVTPITPCRLSRRKLLTCWLPR